MFIKYIKESPVSGFFMIKKERVVYYFPRTECHQGYQCCSCIHYQSTAIISSKDFKFQISNSFNPVMALSHLMRVIQGQQTDGVCVWGGGVKCFTAPLHSGFNAGVWIQLGNGNGSTLLQRFSLLPVSIVLLLWYNCMFVYSSRGQRVKREIFSCTEGEKYTKMYLHTVDTHRNIQWGGGKNQQINRMGG